MFSTPDKYKFLTSGNVLVAGINDAQEYEDTREAMDIMGMTEDEQTGRDYKGILGYTVHIQEYTEILRIYYTVHVQGYTRSYTGNQS